ncbi:MobA/MobL family protein [Mesorhizobium sangaii]|nr:MobA/MobL family protein [Mesorhizobium sangaii]
MTGAAYRRCAAMKNETYGRCHDFSNKWGDVHSEFALPTDAPAWALELAALAGGSDTLTQVELNFPIREAAVGLP